MNYNKLFTFLFGCSPDDIPRDIILTPFIGFETFGKHCDSTNFFKGKIYSGIKAVKNGREFCVVKSGIGSALSGDAAFLLSERKNASIIFLGSCGGLGNSEIGDIILGKSAYDGEGFSRYYEDGRNAYDTGSLDRMINSSFEYTEDLEQFLNKENIKFKAGTIYTIGSIAAENDALLKNIEKAGFSALEMELSAVYTAAEKNNAKSTSLLFVSDLPLEKPIWEAADSPGYKEEYSGYIDSIVKAAVNFIMED